MNIYFIALNNFKNDTRILKEMRSVEKLTNLGITLFAIGDGELPDREKVAKKSEVIRLPLMLNQRWLPKNIRYLLATFEWTLRLILSFNVCSKSDRIIHVHDLKPLPIAVLLKWLSRGRTKIIYDCHEYETEVQFFNSRPILKKIFANIESFCMRWVDDVICVTNSIAEEYAKIYKIKKPYLVMNCPPYKDSAQSSDVSLRKIFGIQDGQKVFLYQGAIVPGRGVLESIQAFKELNHDHVLVFLGYGTLVPDVVKATRECKRIFYHEAVAPDVLLSYTRSADIGICFAPNICLSYYYSLSNKIFEYIQARLPLIVSPLYEFKKLVEGENIGLVTADDSISSIKNSIEGLTYDDIAKFKQNCERIAKTFCWEEQEKVLGEIYKKYI